MFEVSPQKDIVCMFLDSVSHHCVAHDHVKPLLGARRQMGSTSGLGPEAKCLDTEKAASTKKQPAF